MSLTLTDLDKVAAAREHQCVCGSSAFSDLIDYARERAAREALRAILPTEFEIWLHEQDAEYQGSELAWTVTTIHGDDQIWLYAATPAVAYLAVLATWQARIDVAKTLTEALQEDAESDRATVAEWDVTLPDLTAEA
jgi:hypothetical protein